MGSNITKIGVISDTHIPSCAEQIPPLVLEEFKKVDLVIHAGDLVDLSVLETLEAVCHEVKVVCGNMDSTVIKKRFPEKEILALGGFKIGIMHGWGAPVNLKKLLWDSFKRDGVDIIIFGHSHNSLNQTEEGILFFNPGSPTDKMFAKENTFGIITLDKKIEGEIIKL
jgi:putative phosphoesterase